MNKYIYLLAVVFGLSGCNDFWRLSPTNKVIETDYYKTQEDLTEALVAAYDPLKWNAYNAYSSYELVSNIMSDDAETGGSTVSDQPQLQRVNDFTNWVTPTNLPEGLWGVRMREVNRANIVIEKCPLLPEGRCRRSFVIVMWLRLISCVYFIISSCGVSLDTYRITRRIWDWMI